MTAYGRATAVSSLGRFAVEIISINRKYLEFNNSLPKELARFDSDIRKWVIESISRGNISVKVTASYDEKSPLAVAPNLPLARQLKNAWEKIADDLGLDEKSGFCLSMLTEEPGILIYEEDLQDEEQYRKLLHEAVAAALSKMMEMKIREGTELQRDISSRVQNIATWLEQIAEKAPGATEKYRLKLAERLAEVLQGNVDNSERILREVCLYAERIDISEEITRIRSHLKQFQELMETGKDGVGKTLEFIIQELNRESNTIGSKISDVDAAYLNLNIKSELERIREQIQNVE